MPAPKPPYFWPPVEARVGLTPEAAGVLGQRADERSAALRGGDAAIRSVDWAPIQSASA